MNTNFNESSIPSNFCQVGEQYSFEMMPTDIHFFFESMFKSVSEFLGFQKRKEQKTALEIQDLKGNMLLAAIVAYHPGEGQNEDGTENPGNWSYVMTFNEEDIKDCNVYFANDTVYQMQIAKTAMEHCGLEFNNPSQVYTLVSMAASTLRDWLDANAKEGEEVSVELPDYFISSVVIENGEKVMSLVPEGELKRLIKGDADLEQ